MVSATSDGASVNTGIYNGVLTQMKRERSWLITIHCASHRAELAMKDSLMKQARFKKVNDLHPCTIHSTKKLLNFAVSLKIMQKSIMSKPTHFLKCMEPASLVIKDIHVKVLLNIGYL